MKIDKLNLTEKKFNEVLDKIFAKINHKLVSSVLYKTNANYKGRHAKTKQQINKVYIKIYAQKELVMEHASRKHQYLLAVVLHMVLKVNCHTKLES